MCHMTKVYWLAYLETIFFVLYTLIMIIVLQ